MPTRKHKQRRILKTKKRGGFKSDEEIIAQLKQEYVNKIMNNIKYHFNNQLMYDFIDRYQYAPHTIIPSYLKKDPIENKRKISFENLKNQLKTKCHLKTNNIESSEDWNNDIYNKITTAYINSKNIRDFLFNDQMIAIREDYFKLFENYVSTKIKIEPENHHMSYKYDKINKIEQFDNKFSFLHIHIRTFKKIGKRNFHIDFKLVINLKTLLTSSTELIDHLHNDNKCNLFNFDGFKNYEIDDKTKLLTVLNKAAPTVLDAETLDIMNDYV